MLDFFLILGQIPGTDLTITFNEIVLAFIFAWLTYVEFRPAKKSPQIRTIWDSLINYDIPDLKPVVSLARNPASPAVNAWLAWSRRHWRRAL